MVEALLSPKQILNAKRVLVMSNLDLGGFIYHGALLKSLKQSYPHLTIDIWLDKCKFGQKPVTRERNDILESLMLSTGLVDVVFSPAKGDSDRETLIRRAKHRSYDVIFYLTNKRAVDFAKVACLISDKAILAGNIPTGITERLKGIRYFRHIEKRFYLDLHNENTHMLTVFKHYYEKCFGPLTIACEDKFGAAIPLPDSSFVAINKWINEQRISGNEDIEYQPKVLINPISASKARDLNGNTLKRLIKTLLGEFPNILIVINVPPSANAGMHALLNPIYSNQAENQRVSVFTAKDDFYMLMALMNCCDFIITVEASIMHLAATMDIPQMAIVRKKAEKWKPLRANDIFWCEGDIQDCCDRSLASRALKNIQKALEDKHV